MYHVDDTIAAIASASGGAARGIVRISGPKLHTILTSCFSAAAPEYLADISRATAASGTIVLDGPAARALPADVYYWPEGRSYTRQTAGEIHTIGSPPLLSAVLSTVCAAGARPAEPGEFTLRAFLAGRLDLTQAEAVLGVIDARGERQFRAALDQLAGGLSRPLTELRESLLGLLAEVEAGLDFVEDDIQFVSRSQIGRQLDEATLLLDRIAGQLNTRRRTDRLSRVVLVGWPNVGKSSLFNALSRPGNALVSDSPGTTRDYLTAPILLGGTGCQLVDTAGHEPAAAAGEIRDLSQQLTVSQAEACDLRLVCLDVTRAPNAWEQAQLTANPAIPQLVVLTKCDSRLWATSPPIGVATSAHLAMGLDELRRAIARALDEIERGESASSLSAQRCVESLRAAREAIDRASGLNAQSAGEELLAAELRTALGALGQVVGAVYTDDILDRIFSRFCIGK